MTARLRNLWLALALGVLALAAYANSFRTGFVIDSRAIVLADPRVHSTTWEGVRQIFTEHYWWPTAPSDLYRPLTTLSYWFNYVVLGHADRPLGYHVINFALHLANVLLLWRLAWRLSASPALAWLTAALFAVHPVGVEAVTNIVGRADLLATLAVLAMALAWWRAETAASVRAAWGWRLLAAVCGVLGVLAKENAIMGVAGIGMLALWRGGRSGMVASLRRGAGVVVPVVVVFAAIRIWIHAHAVPLDQVYVNTPVTGAAGVLTAIGVLGRYLGLLLWPASLSCDYSYPQIAPFGRGGMDNLVPLASLAVIAVLATVAWRRRTAWPHFAFGLAWGAVMLFPTSNLVVRIGSIMAERFLYLPLTGFALAGAAALTGAAAGIGRTTGKRALGYALPVMCVVALAARTFARNFDWQDERTIWAAALRVCPRSFNTHKGFATTLISEPLNDGRLDEAIAHLEKARALLDSPPLPLEREDNTVWPDLGRYYRRKAELCAARGEAAVAVQWAERSCAVFEKSIAANRAVGAGVKRRYAARGDAEAAARTYGNPRLYLELAVTLLRLNRSSEAEAALLERRRIDPVDSEGLVLLGMIARDRGSMEVAAARFMQAVLLGPGNERAWRELADVYAQLGLSPAPVTVRAGGGSLDASLPRVRADLDAALVELVQTFQLAGRNTEAQIWRERAIRDYGCRPELFR